MATQASAAPALRALAAPVPGARVARSLSGRATWRWVTLALVALDTVGLLTAFALAYVARFKTGLPLLDTPPYSGSFYSSIAYWAIPAWVGLLALYGLYERRFLFAGLQEYMRIANACTAGVLVLVLISFLDKSLLISRGWLVLTWLVAIVLVVSLRFAARRGLRFVRVRGMLTTPTLIVGVNEEAVALAEQFLADPGSGVRVLGFVDAGLPSAEHAVGHLQVLGNLDNLKDLVRHWGVRELVVATTAISRDELLELYRSVGQDEAVSLRLSSGLFEILTTGVQVEEISRVPLMTPHRTRITGADAMLKTLVDYSGAGLALVLLAPVILGLGLLVRLDSPGPAFHRRRVLGVSGKPFHALKFRTMIVDADDVLARDATLRTAFDAGYKLKDDPRITRVGRLLRKTSLDELPQLVNVLRGEMSLVGPRMIAPDEAPRYGKWQLNLLTVKPGITGPWQVEGRGDLPYDQRVRLSMQYIRNHSVWLDLAILLRTVLVVLRGRGAY
jgi:exopolysaccharide biosynthesis polyprenyl glycosylphosphotransferase